MKRKLTVDRIEDIFAVCENKDGKMENIKLELFDFKPVDGDRIKEKNGRYIKISNRRKKKKISNLFKSLIG
ncbi:MAG: DUF3006 domain-containing protein [Lachnospiraceae bacterium]|nr:DUF3006 domain-containing protein [Lachnospiraceae bacterium]